MSQTPPVRHALDPRTLSCLLLLLLLLLLSRVVSICR